MASSAADDQHIGLFSGVWSRLRAAVSGWRRRGENEGEEAIARSRLARRRLGRKLAFVSFNLEVLVFIYAFWRARRRNLNWRQPIQALPMLVIPALATLIYAAFIRFTRTLDLKDNKMIQRLQEEKQTNDCVLREFDQDDQNSAKKYDCTDDPSNFSAAVASAETSKLGTSRQLGINLKDNGGSGTDMAWDHSKDFQPTHSDDVQWRRFSVEETCMTNNNAVIQPIDWVSERVADNSKHLDDMPRRVGHLCTSGTDVGENSMTYCSAETDTCLPDCNIVHINSNTMDHAECSTPMNNPKCNRGVAEENSVRIALTGPMTDLPAFAELLDEGVQENESSKFYVSQENGMPSISKTEVLVGSYAIKNTEQHLETSGFSFCSQETEKEDAAAGVCFVSINPALTFLSSPELVVKGSKYASKKEINTQYENDVVVNSEEEAFVISTDKQCSGTPGFFLHDQDSNMVETPSVVDIVAVRPEPNYPAPAESLTYALDDVDFKEYETSNVHLLEQKGEEVFLDPLLADSYEDSFAISKLLSHSEAAKMTDVAGEDLSESLDKGASSHQNNVAVSSDYGGRTDNMIWDVQLTTESNILEAHQDGKETLSDSIHHSNSHSAGIFLSSSKLINDEAYLSNSHSYFLYSNIMEDESPLPGLGGCRESKDGIDLAFLDTPILLDEVTSAESWTDNAVCSRYVRDNGSTESLHDGNQVQSKTSERANFDLEERLIFSEEGIKSEIFSLYSRSSSCVSDVNMIETLTGVTFPEPKNDNNFSVVERNPMMDPNIFHADSYTNNTRSAEFIADIDVMENLNAGKEAGAGSVHDVSLSFLNTLGASDVSRSIGKTDNLDSLSSSFVPEVDTFKGLQAGQRFSEQQYENDFAFCKVEVFPKEVKDDEDFLSGMIGDIQCSKETSFYAPSGLSRSQDDEFTPYSTCMSSDGISNAENYLISDSYLHNIVESHRFIENMFLETQPQDPLSFGKVVVNPDELCVSENNPGNSKSSLCLHMDGYQRATPRQQDESNLGFEEIDIGHQGATSKSPLNSLGYQCVSDSNMVKNLEMLQSAQSSSPEILHDSSLGGGSSISVDGGNDFNNSSYNPGSVMHTAEMNTDNFLGLKEGVGEKTVVSISQHEVDTTETNCSNWIYAEATMTGAVKHVNKHPSHSQDEYPVTSFSSDKDNSSMNHSNYSISSSPMPDENLIQIPGAVKEGSFEPNYEYPSSFEETSKSRSYSYNNTMSALHASMKVSVRSSRKKLPDLVLEDIDRFGEISGDEMSNKSQSENGLNCELTAITEAETLYTKIQDCTEASNIDSTKASNIDITKALNIDTTKASESVTEGLFETEHHRGPELVLNLVGIPFIDEDEGKKTEQDCGSSNVDSCHHEVRILETLQELPVAVGTEKGLLEDSNSCGCNCIDKEPKDLGINDIEKRC